MAERDAAGADGADGAIRTRMRTRIAITRPRFIAVAAIVALAIAASAVAATAAAPRVSTAVEIRIHYSHYEPSSVAVPRGVPVTFTLRNDDPIEHEWIVGDAAVHERHRTGTEPHHGERPTEVSIPAMTTVTTVVTFPTSGSLQYICHLPGHEAYGMVGTVDIR